jgi:hypothetical protein
MKKKLIKALAYLENGTGIHLGEDVFLTGYLDGSDKLYGFYCEDNGLFVSERSGTYSINDIGKDELTYIFNLSAPNIFKKICNKEYEIVETLFGGL